MIASLSGIRGVLNKDMALGDVSRFAANFFGIAGSKEVLLARDTRSTGPAISRTVTGSLMSRGARVIDYGIISTPALFRESRTSGRPAIMVTASHNEPEFNGLKFIVDGMGIGRDAFESVTSGTRNLAGQFSPGALKVAARSSYVDDLVGKFGAGTFAGARVAVDLGGGAAISHAVQLLRRLGCDVVSVNDAYGVFNRRIDPMADELTLLRRIVKGRDCDIGLGFDCDGDRLAIVDAVGKKRSGDYMLTLAVSELLAETGERKVVVSLDTTRGVDDVVGKAGGQVFRSRVGEANVVMMMKEKDARLGGEGSSGGLVDGTFNHCRDSMLAALVIIGAISRKGRKVYESVPSYHQERVSLVVPRTKAQHAIRTLANGYDDSDTSDGVKISLSKRSWVLIRPSGTEDLVRVSAEAETAEKAVRAAKLFASKLKELAK